MTCGIGNQFQLKFVELFEIVTVVLDFRVGNPEYPNYSEKLWDNEHMTSSTTPLSVQILAIVAGMRSAHTGFVFRLEMECYKNSPARK